MPPKKKPQVNLEETRRHLEATKALVVSLGLPYARVRNLDDAIKVVEMLEARTK